MAFYMNGEAGKAFLQTYLEKTAPLLKDYLTEKVQEAKEVGRIAGELIEAYAAMAQLGKKIRGALFVLGYELGGKEAGTEILKASLAFEHLHAGFLIHDDIMDKDQMRRGLPSIHALFTKRGLALGLKSDIDTYGISMGILAGCAAYFYALQTIVRSGLAAEDMRLCMDMFVEYALRVDYGQALDVTNISLQSMDEQEILNILKYKSAEYTGVMPLIIGASLGGIKGEKLIAITEYGLAFGWAFQLQDDILGLIGKEEDLGKPVGSDIVEGKNTLIVLHCYRNASEKEREFMLRVLGNKQATPQEVEALVELIKHKGSVEYALNKGWEYVEKGIKTIPNFTDNERLGKIFSSLIYYMMERTK